MFTLIVPNNHIQQSEKKQCVCVCKQPDEKLQLYVRTDYNNKNWYCDYVKETKNCQNSSLTHLEEFSDSSSANSSDNSSITGSTTSIVFLEPALPELSETLALVAELSEELDLELFYDTFRTVLDPAVLTISL